MTDEANRNPDGTFKEGNKLGGLTQKGRATWRKRVEQIEEKYDSVEKLMALFVQDPATGKMAPGPELLAMHPRDAGLIMQMLGAIVGDDKFRERESFWDRDEGKAAQRHRVAGDPDNPTPISLDGSFSLVFGTDGNDSDQGTAPDPAVDKA